jgi:hypothetical protein
MGEPIRYDVSVTIKPEHRQALADLLAKAAQEEGDVPELARHAFIEDDGRLRIDDLDDASEGDLVELADWVKAYCEEDDVILWSPLAGDVSACGYVFNGKGKAKRMELRPVGKWH